MTFETCKKGLNILGKFDIAIGALYVLCAIIFFASGTLFTNSGSDFIAALGLTAGISIGFVVLVQGAFNLLEGILSLRAVKDSAKVKPAWSLAILTTICSGFCLINNFVQHADTSTIVGTAVGLAINGLFLYFTTVIKKQNELIAA